MFDRQTRQSENKKIEKLSRETFTIIPSGEVYKGNMSLGRMGWLKIYLPNKNGELEEMTTFNQQVNGQNSQNKNSSQQVKIPNKMVDDSIQHVNWGIASAYSPDVRAKLIYDALFEKRIDYIYITGGRGNEDTINELNKLIETQKPTIIADKMPIVYGMSDATNMLNYLGQRNLARCFIAGNGISSIFKGQRLIKEEELKELNNKNEEVSRRKVSNSEVEGVLIPEYLLSSYGTLQEMRLFKDRVNFLATEIHFSGETELMKNIYSSIKPEDRKNIVFCMSAVGIHRKEITPDEYEAESGRKLGEDKQRQLEAIIRSNDIKENEQSEFKKWCEENGFKVVEGVEFGHNNNPGNNNVQGQYLPIPVYCECKLIGDRLQYSFNSPFKPNENAEECFADVNISKKEVKECHELSFYHKVNGDFYGNYIPGGATEVSKFVENGNIMPIFAVKNLKPDENGVFNIKFIDRQGCPQFIYIKDLERALRDIRSLNMEGLKEIKIDGFDLEFGGKNREVMKKAIKDIVSYISREYLKDITINIGNTLEFNNGKSIENKGLSDSKRQDIKYTGQSQLL